MDRLRSKVRDKSARLAVVGLGYVGLPVACLFADKGFDVLGIEIRGERVAEINAGRCPIGGEEPGLADLVSRVVESKRLRASTGYGEVGDRDIVLIDVETPVDDDGVPQYEALRSVLQALAPVRRDGALVIVESTIAPGTMDGLVLPILEGAGRGNVNSAFFLGHCPERVMPGKLLKNLRTVGRVVGGMSTQTTGVMIDLYRHVVEADLDPVDCITAELVKTTENAYRDVQIAFANEVALICEAVDGNVWKVRELVNKTPFRHMHMPGSGVGGHCIPKDPWLLAYGVKDKQVPLRLIPAARAINDSMPDHVVDRLTRELRALGREVSGTRVAVLGYSYLENSDDTRNSPSIAVVQRLRDLGSEVVIHDPHVAGFQGDLVQLAMQADALVVMVAHQGYRNAPLAKIRAGMRTPLLLDCRAFFSRVDVESAGLIYAMLGASQPKRGADRA
jgi:UDP-N-acetyl-D-mannosaminuronic acid dehydrogenase